MNLKTGRLLTRNWQASISSSRALAQCGRTTTGQVLAVFPDVAYLGTDAGDVLALSAREIPLGPLSISLETVSPAFPEWLSTEETVRFRPAQILLDGTSVGLEGAAMWDPYLPVEALTHASGDLLEALEALAQAIRRAAPQGSLAGLLEDSQPPGAGDTESRILRAASTTARRALEVLAEAIHTGEPEPLGRAAAGLAGLGGGFTPAGDDFLMGMALGLWATLPGGHARSLARAIAEAAAPRTTSVSAAYLCAAADGAAPARWHALLNALVRDDLQGVRSEVRRLCAVGHTSGADSLTGFSLTLRGLLVPSPTTI